MHVVADAGTNVPVDPLGDIETIDLELIMADLDMVNRRVEKAAKAAKGDKKFLHEAEVFRALAEHLNAGRSARTFDCGDEDRAIVETADLLSLKPIIYAANMDEAGFADHENNRYFRMVRDLAQKEGAQVLPICAKLEEDIAQLDDPDERAMFLEDLGVEQSGLDRLIQCSYELLGLISFLTYGKDECRAWTIRKGTKAPQAAGKIHSDIERGFIRAVSAWWPGLQSRPCDHLPGRRGPEHCPQPVPSGPAHRHGDGDGRRRLRPTGPGECQGHRPGPERRAPAALPLWRNPP